MAEKRGMKALELWCRRVTDGYPGVKIENMTTSWRDGLAFCALIHHFRPDLIDFDRLDKREIYKNNELAFRIAERQLGIPALLDAEDMVEYEVPDRLSILTYLSQFYQAFVGNQQGTAKSSSRTHQSKVAEIISPSAKNTKASKVSSGRLETCWSCRRPVFLAERLVIGGKLRHRTCFTCKRCGNQLNLVGFYETETGHYVCETCPDEEKREQNGSGKKVVSGVKDKEEEDEEEDDEEDSSVVESVRDEYSLNFEIAMDSISVPNRTSDGAKRKFLEDLIDDSFDSAGEPSGTKTETEVAMPKSEPEVKSGSENLPSPQAMADDAGIHRESGVRVKMSTTLFTPEALSRLGCEPEDLISEVRGVIVSVIEEAVKRVEDGVKDKPESNLSPDGRDSEVKSNDVSSTIINEGSDSVSEVINPSDAVAQSGVSGDESVVGKDEGSGRVEEGKEAEKEVVRRPPAGSGSDYPEDLNPFADDEDAEECEPVKPSKPPVTPRRNPIPAARTKALRDAAFNQAGQKIIEAPTVNLNPFWTDGEPSSDEDVAKPVPAPRTTSKKTTEEDFSSTFSRSRHGSFASLSSVGSSVTVHRRKKGPAPQPPSNTKSLPYPSIGFRSGSPVSPTYRSPSPSASVRSHRKSKPAPPPPPILKSDDKEMATDKKEKNHENKVKQNLSVPDKSSYGKWKRKKVPAPALPIPQRRRITPLPLSEFYRELEDLEIQQRELERQGVTIEQTIRSHEMSSADESVADDDEGTGGKDLEGMILQLFDIVNQKNELFRKQAELMYLRRQQRLEEEHADIEYQIRCLMGRPERNKTDSDKAQEEELIRRLIEVVERRNEIIECLDMDRRREVEEDRSIHHHLEAFAGKKESEMNSAEVKQKSVAKISPSLLKFVKKKKWKKDKGKDDPSRKDRRLDVDKDVDEGIRGDEEEEEDGEGREVQEETKKSKTKKKWFVKS